MIWRNNCFEHQKEAEAKYYSVKGQRVVFGAPKASVAHTAEELANRGLVGVYVVEDKGDDQLR